jgi:protein O-mannosyl-transferase
VATKSPRSSGPLAPTPDRAPRLPRYRRPLLALLAAVTCAAFAGALRNGWVSFDDPHYVYENLHVNRGLRLDGLWWFLSHPHGENWHPLTSWSHMLDVQLFGLAPAGHHAVSVLLHALNAVLLVIVLHRMTGAWWRSLLVGGLFALHPLRVESVAWISERKDVLSGLFFLLALEAYRRWAVRPGRARYAALVAALALGLMSKPMLVTLPFVLVLLDVWPFGRLQGRPRNPAIRAPVRALPGLIAEKWPLFGLAVLSAVVTFLVQRRGGAVVSVERLAFARRVANALVSCWRYVGKTLWPHDLAVIYRYSRGSEALAAVVATVALLAVTALFLWQARRRPYLVVGWLWYLGMLVPVIGLIQVGSQAYADRYTYLPTIGLLVALVWFVGERVADSRSGRALATGASFLVLAGLSTVTVRQVAVWKDTRTLFEHALAVTDDNAVAHEKLAEVLLQEGRTQLAVEHLETALRLQPGYGEAHVNLGIALGMLGRNGEAIAHFRAGLATNETAEARHNLAFTLAKTGRLDEAIPEYEAALRLDPDRYLTLVQLGTALVSRGRPAEAVTALQHALELNPADLETRRLLAIAALQSGRVGEAIAAYREILRRGPDDLDALNNVAWIRATCADAGLRDGAEAVRLAERARDRSPEPRAVLYSTLAAAYAEAGRFPEAIRACARAIELAQAAGAADEVAAYAGQLAKYRAGKPFHFGG